MVPPLGSLAKRKHSVIRLLAPGSALIACTDSQGEPKKKTNVRNIENKEHNGTGREEHGQEQLRRGDLSNSHTTAEAAIKELERSGFDMKKLSIVGLDYHTDEHVVGYCNIGDRMCVAINVRGPHGWAPSPAGARVEGLKRRMNGAAPHERSEAGEEST